MSLTTIVNHDVPAGIGGGGNTLQSTAGSVSTAPDVVCANVFATPYDQSQATIVPGAVDVVPLNVHLMVLPPLVNLHVSVSVGPVTPKRAVATVGGVTDSVANAEVPRYVPVTVLDIEPATARVDAVNVALADPAGTVTLAGTITGSLADKDTAAPPAGAAALKPTVPATEVPPTTLVGLSEIEVSTAPTSEVTVSVGDWTVLPLRDALMMVVPADTAAIAIGALEEPGGTTTDDCTVATDGLLLNSETVAPPAGAAAVMLTVPCQLTPAATVATPSATLDTPGPPFEGPDGESELLHPIAAPVAIRMTVNATSGLANRLTVISPFLPLGSTPERRWLETSPPSPCR